MDVIVPKVCEKHKMQANKMCTKKECFQQANILICPQCSSRHFQHKDDIIQISLLNEKVHELMKKRMEFQINYEKSCQALIQQLKKFKAFKEQIVTSLNIRERYLNDLCKKIRRSVPYEKDKQLFKNHFGYVYLTMKGINPNLELYNKFRNNINETIVSCRKSLHKFQLNCGRTQITTLLKKQQQISSILKKTKEAENIKYFQPTFNKFKKQTVKFASKNSIDPNSKLMRVSNDEFLLSSGQWLSWYNASNCLFPKNIPLGRKISDMALIDKNLFITTQQAGILIYDILNQKLLKQYASSNHKNASITGLLSINNSTVLNFITYPNQIVSLKFNEELGTLKVVKGVETKSKQIDAQVIHDNFVSLFDDKSICLYSTDHLEKERQIQFPELMKSVAKINDNSFAVAGQSQHISLLDNRCGPIVNKIRVNEHCKKIVKIYPYSLLASCGKNLKIYDLRVQQQLFNCKTDDVIRNLQVLTSQLFVTAGNSLNIWSSIS